MTLRERLQATLDRHPRTAWACGVAISIAVVGYIFIFHSDGGDLYPNWRAARAVLDGMPAYARYDWPFPYLYPPGFVLPMIPLAQLDFHTAVRVFFLFNVAGVAVGTACCLRLCGVQLRSPVTPVAMAFVSLSPPLVITLVQGNVNGLLLAGEGAFLLLAARGRWLAAGTVLGLTLTVKPLLLPLLVVPILWRRLDATVAALAVPVMLSAIAFPLMRDGSAFFTSAIPYLLRGESGNELGNTTIAGVFALAHAPLWSAWLLRIAAAITALVVILRTTQRGEVGLVNISAAALVASFLAFSFSSQYFALYLLPLVLSASLPGAAMTGALAWVGVYLVDGPDLFLLYRLGAVIRVGPVLGTLRSTAGYALILAGLAVAAKYNRRVSLQPRPTPAAGKR